MQQPGYGQEPPPPSTPPGAGQQPPPPPSTPPGFGPPPQPYAPPTQPYGQPPQPYAAPPQPHAPYPAPGPAYAPGPAPMQPQQAPTSPEFLAVDLHNSVVVDASGISFEDHGLSIDFTWPEVGRVHYRPDNTGKGLVVGVVHVDGRFYECVVDAKRRDRLQEWFGQLLAVLRHYRPMG